MSAFPDIFPSKTIDKAFQNFLGWFPVPLNWKVLHDLSKWLLKTFPSKPLSKPLSWVNLPVMAFWTEWWTSSKSNMCTISHSRNIKKHSNIIGQNGTNHTYVHRFVQLYFTHAHKPIIHATMFCFAFLGFSTPQTAVKKRDFFFLEKWCGFWHEHHLCGVLDYLINPQRCWDLSKEFTKVGLKTCHGSP